MHNVPIESILIMSSKLIQLINIILLPCNGFIVVETDGDVKDVLIHLIKFIFFVSWYNLVIFVFISINDEIVFTLQQINNNILILIWFIFIQWNIRLI